jgi:hypothetical protein
MKQLKNVVNIVFENIVKNIWKNASENTPKNPVKDLTNQVLIIS